MGMSRVDIIMVAERAVQQGLLDLRADCGVKFAEIDAELHKNTQAIIKRQVCEAWNSHVEHCRSASHNNMPYTRVDLL